MWLYGEKREFTHYNADLKVDDTKVIWSYVVSRKKPTSYKFNFDHLGNVHESFSGWSATCSEIYLNRNAQTYIPKLISEYDGEPVEVELVVDNENPLFYVQRIPDVKGIEHLYASPKSYTAISRKKRGFWSLWKSKKIEAEQLPKDQGRLPMRMFPEITAESGIVGLSVKLKGYDV